MRIVLSAMLVIIVFLGLVTPAGSQARHKVRILLAGRTPEPVLPQPHIAQAMGYFQEEGLEVTLVYPGGGVDAFKFLALGRGDFAIGSSNNLVLGVQNGDPFRSVCSFVYRFTHELVVLATSPVKTVKDLQGKKIGVSSLWLGCRSLCQRAVRGSGTVAI